MKNILITLSFSALLCACAAPGPYDGNWKTTAGQQGDWRDEVIYQLLVDRFGNGNLNNDDRVVPGMLGRFQGGDWQGVIDHFDYLEELGVTALWISPVVRNLETDAGFDSYHGYWQQDFEQVNPHFGDLAKLRELVARAHERGFKVILDIVTNHIAQLFYYDINGNGSPDDNVYGAGCGVHPPMDTQPCPNPAIITHLTEYDPDFDPLGVRGYTSLGFSGPAPVRWIYDPAINRVPTAPAEFANDAWYHKNGRIIDYGSRDQVLTGDFPGGLKDLRTEDTAVRAALIKVFAKWIQAADFDGFRIDTLKHVEHEFWQDFCPAIREYAAGTRTIEGVPPMSTPKKRFFMFGESFDGNDDLNGSYTFNQEVDSTFYFSQKFSVFDGVFKNGGPTKQIEEQWMRKETKYSTVPNANGIDLAAKDSLVNFLDNHDVPRFLFDKPVRAALWNALTFLLTEDGIPCIYYGTEQEFSGGNDPQNRERLWDSGYRTDGPTFTFLKRLIAVRKAYAPLRRGAMTIRWSTSRTADEEDAGVFAFDRQEAGKTVLVVLNTSQSKTSSTSAVSLGGSEMTTGFAAGTVLEDVLATDEPARAASRVTVGPGGTLTVTLAAQTAKVLVPLADIVSLGN